MCMQVYTAMGCSAGFALAPVTGKQPQEVVHLGQAHTQKADPVAAAALAGQGKVNLCW